MSFLTEAASRRLAALPVAAPRLAATQAQRTFATSALLNKTATESVKDGLKTVDRAVSDKLVDGINISTTVASKAKEVAEDVVGTKHTGKAAEVRGEVSGKASELSGEAKGKAKEAAGTVSGKAEELKRKM